MATFFPRRRVIASARVRRPIVSGEVDRGSRRCVPEHGPLEGAPEGSAPGGGGLTRTARGDAAGTVDGTAPSTAPWKTTERVFHRVHRLHCRSLRGAASALDDFAELDVHNSPVTGCRRPQSALCSICVRQRKAAVRSTAAPGSLSARSLRQRPNRIAPSCPHGHSALSHASCRHWADGLTWAAARDSFRS
jgi:hypothetical protein